MKMLRKIAAYFALGVAAVPLIPWFTLTQLVMWLEPHAERYADKATDLIMRIKGDD